MLLPCTVTDLEFCQEWIWSSVQARGKAYRYTPLGPLMHSIPPVGPRIQPRAPVRSQHLSLQTAVIKTTSIVQNNSIVLALLKSVLPALFGTIALFLLLSNQQAQTTGSNKLCFGRAFQFFAWLSGLLLSCILCSNLIPCSLLFICLSQDLDCSSSVSISFANRFILFLFTSCCWSQLSQIIMFIYNSWAHFFLKDPDLLLSPDILQSNKEAYFAQSDKETRIESRNSESITAGDYILSRVKSNYSKGKWGFSVACLSRLRTTSSY